MTRLIGVIGFISLSLLVTSCTSTRYVNPQVSQSQATRDGMECRMLAEQGTPPGGLMRGTIVEVKVSECLTSRGYQPEKTEVGQR